MEMHHMEEQAKSLEEKYRIAAEQLADTKEKKVKNQNAQRAKKLGIEYIPKML